MISNVQELLGETIEQKKTQKEINIKVKPIDSYTAVVLNHKVLKKVENSNFLIMVSKLFEA